MTLFVEEESSIFKEDELPRIVYTCFFLPELWSMTQMGHESSAKD